MATDPIETLIQELMADYDPTIDTSSGSGFYRKVISPLLVRIGTDPLNADAEDVIVAHVQENIEGMDVGPRSGIRDLVARPLSVGMEPWSRELRGIKVASSLDNYESMTREEVNALLANFFIELRDGDKAQVTARMYFSAAQTVVVTPLTNFSTGSGLNFYPTTTQSITSTSMSFNQENGLYYFDVTLEAESAGEAYNVEAGEINSVSGIAGVIRVTNKSRPTSVGSSDETKLEGITRARESITLRTLSVLRGCKTVLQKEYASIDAIEVVGMGDDLMLRDVITGPVSISGIPGGFVGADPASIGSGQAVHIGGKTDIWLFTTAPVAESIDISNLTDKGVRIFAGQHGFTNPGPGTTTTFQDTYGRFTTRGVLTGDYLRIGDEEIQINARSETSLTLASPLDESLSEQFYEIVRYESSSSLYGGTTSRYLDIPLYALVAESDGEVVLDDDGDVVLPVPGDPDLAAFLDGGGDPVKLTENIADSNIKLPLVRIVNVVFLDSIDLTETGDTIPLADLLLIRADGEWTGGTISTKATGSLKFYFKDPVNFFVDPDTFRAQVSGGSMLFQIGFIPIPNNVSITGNGTDPTEAVITGANFTNILSAGYRIKADNRYWTIIDDGVYAAGNTTFTIRETVVVAISTLSAKGLYGVLEADMTADDTGLYYASFSGIAGSNGVAGNIADETELTPVTGVSSYFAEGYTLANLDSELSYSSKERPYLRVTRYVNDDKDFGSISTAYAVRVNYAYAEGFSDIQDYVEDEDNRPVGEDILIRHMLPSYVFIDTTTDLGADSSETAIIDFLLAKDPTEDLELSDVVNELYASGAEYVAMPFSALVLNCSRTRTWTAEVVTDTDTTDRIHHYIADEDSITTAES